MPFRSMPALDFGGRTPSFSAVGPAIDLTHLSRQALGDHALEVELLHLFDRQAARIAGELAMPDLSPGARAERQDLAHTLKGSARAVGAWRVADACQELEERLRLFAAPASLEEACLGVRQAVSEARAFIAAGGA